MTTWAKIILDSIHPTNGKRLTTLELNYPYIIHAEVMTHKVFSRNAASSRAIKTEHMIAAVRADPFVPTRFPRKADPDVGMSPDGFFDAESLLGKTQARAWLAGVSEAIKTAEHLSYLGVHKQIASRPLMPYMHIRTLVTATEFENFFSLRLDPDAQEEIQELARCMKRAMDESAPTPRDEHLPFIQEPEASRPERFLISAGRCARISYLTHDGVHNVKRDVDIGRRLLRSGHMSPFEHLADSGSHVESSDWSGNLRGWRQYRKTIPGEAVWVKE